MPFELHALIQDKSSDNDLEKSEQEARYIAKIKSRISIVLNFTYFFIHHMVK
jgi:hypothetical protein